jgi:NOL1/NOP2/fmu family ribosome biogenesis protein
VDGYGIGWGKRVQGRVKNHFPRGWMQGSSYHG